MAAPSSFPADHAVRLDRARLAVEGLSLGDAFGQQFFHREGWTDSASFRTLPPPVWKYTDDAEMALGIFEVLARHGRIDQKDLAAAFGQRYVQNPYRGYGPGMHGILSAISAGSSWNDAAGSVFGGEGSLGNGGAMRVAPVGAYFADDLDAVARQSVRSTEITHLHPEGIAGAVAVAIATAWAWQQSVAANQASATTLFTAVIAHTPQSLVRKKIEEAAEIPLDAWEFTAAERLGNGSAVTALDTVPLCIWLAARHLDDYCEALWTAAKVGGDIDTNCAIVGGIVALSVGREGLPEPWLRRRESLQWTS